MQMQKLIEAEIDRLANKKLKRQRNLVNKRKKAQRNFAKRTGLSAKPPTRPATAPVHRQFDPKYCKRHAKHLAKVIWYKVRQKTYEPMPAIHSRKSKPTGGYRDIMAFSIPDSALANVMMKRARGRNKKRLSPQSFAYHPDKNIFDAVLNLCEFDFSSKVFAVQIDFKNFFDSIPTSYLKAKMNDASLISLTPHERYVFEAFLRHRFFQRQNYLIGSGSRRKRGTPQGSSVSLLLANIANHDLDIDLSHQAGRFARFADDVVALCHRYEAAQSIEQCFHTHAERSGLKLNKEKSTGIAMMTDRHAEMRAIQYFDFLGYRFSDGKLKMPNSTIKRVKSRISNIVNLQLIHYLKYHFNSGRCSSSSPVYDWDLLGAITEIRRYLYGGLTESDLTKFIDKQERLRKVKGLMGFYCLLDDRETLAELDGWLVNMIRRAMVKRNLILKAKFGSTCPTPNNRQLIEGVWLNPKAWRKTKCPDARVPSFIRGWRTARKHYLIFGLEDVEPWAYQYGVTAEPNLGAFY